VKALAHYVTHNWNRMKSAQRKAEGLPFVSARAEAQVRDRSKKRFNVAGAWRLVPWIREGFRKSRGNLVRWQGAKRANTWMYSTDEQRRQRAKGPANSGRIYGFRGLANLEPKATLRAIIHEGDWENFKYSELAHEQSHFAQALQTRLKQAVDEGRLGPGVFSDTDSPQPASEQADNGQSQACAGWCSDAVMQ